MGMPEKDKALKKEQISVTFTDTLFPEIRSLG